MRIGAPAHLRLVGNGERESRHGWAQQALGPDGKDLTVILKRGSELTLC